ncbi:terminase small subunit [Phascolarctobacterium sp.]
MDEISQAQKNFVDYFIETGNQTEAYKKAYPTCKTDNAAAASASKLLRNNKVKAYLDSRMKEISSDKIASATEVLEYLTKVMKGEEKDQFGLDASLNDRTKAAELLGKRYALFKEVMEVEEKGIARLLNKRREKNKK